MKKILLIIFLLFFMPTVNASSSIGCLYNVEGYQMVIYVTDANGGKVTVDTNKNTASKKLSFKTSNLKNFDKYKSGSTIKCPPIIYSVKKNDKVTMYLKKEKKSTENKLVTDTSNIEPEEIPPTDWGEVKDIDLENICSKPEFRKPLKFIGTIVFFLKIAIPVLILVLGTIDLFKAITSSKDDRIMVAVKSIGVRFLAGVCIFFIPGFIELILDWVNEWSNYRNTWCCCTQCILDSNNCDVNSCSSDSCKIGGMN